jgi:hypothetical protein
MRAKEFVVEMVHIPMGANGRATVPAPSILYHSLRRRPESSIGIKAFPLSPKEKELAYMFPKEKRNNGFIWLSMNPLSNDAYMIDAHKLDVSNLRYTGQSEGYLVHAGDIPAEAIMKKFSY